jgi:SAM-dependent methyltransferase
MMVTGNDTVRGPKGMRTMKAWHEEDAFWTTWAPFLFEERRWQQAQAEAADIISLLKLSPGAAILDLCCGPGRHSLQLAQTGFSVTGVDRTKTYLQKARKQAAKKGLDIEFICADMRDFCRPNGFEAVINLFTSFGYFEDISDDKKVVTNAYRSLRNGGVFLIDTMGKEVLARIFRERDWYEAHGFLVLQERKVSRNWGWMEGRWVMVKDGKAEEYEVSHRLYSATDLAALLKDCGFTAVDAYGDLAGAPYDHTAKRLVVVGRKGKEKT